MSVSVSVSLSLSVCLSVCLYSSNRYDVCKSFKSVIMTGTYLGVLEQKYIQMYTADLGYFVNLGNFPDLGNLTCATKIDIMKTILCAQCVEQNLKMKFISCLSVQHM